MACRMCPAPGRFGRLRSVWDCPDRCKWTQPTRLGCAAASVARALPPRAVFLRLMGVDYVRFRAGDGGDLYVTEHGMPFLEHLNPQNWYEPEWFKRNRVPLAGSGTVYRLPTRPIPGHPSPSIPLVVKWSRVGQDVPLDTMALNTAINADFNTPFEEFACWRNCAPSRVGPGGFRILTQRPLAIYIPPERMQLWQTGRSRKRSSARGYNMPGSRSTFCGRTSCCTAGSTGSTPSKPSEEICFMA